MAGERRDLGDATGRTAMVDGSVVNGYTVTYLASGGMSIVYKAEKNGQTVVLKEVQSSNTKEVPSLISEKTLLERLSHPGVVGYHTFFTENGHYYLVVDYVPGLPLSQFLNNKESAAVSDVADWAVQLCEIFMYLHAQKPPIIYRDLKAENILLNDGKLKLIDFGIARVHKGDRQKDTELMGSPVTASPEHYGGAETDARSDIYTLGATIYELLTGGRRKQVGAFQFAPVRDLRPDTPVALDKAIIKALSFKPDDRFQTAEQFRNAILKAMGKPVPAFVERRGTVRVEEERGGPQKSRRGLVIAGGALAILLLVGAVAVKGGYVKSGGPKPGSLEAGLEGNLFGPGQVGKRWVVFMGEDVGLFQVTPWEGQPAKDRAKTLSARLNKFYQAPCAACGMAALEPGDIKIGRYIPTEETVVFYAHMHGDKPAWKPLLLATVDDAQAKALGTTPKHLAAYWRDLMKDTVSLSRGVTIENSALGGELAAAVASARASLSAEESNVDGLRKVLHETTGSQSRKLREVFAKVPSQSTPSDVFPTVNGEYEPLRN